MTYLSKQTSDVNSPMPQNAPRASHSMMEFMPQSVNSSAKAHRGGVSAHVSTQVRMCMSVYYYRPRQDTSSHQSPAAEKTNPARAAPHRGGLSCSTDSPSLITPRSPQTVALSEPTTRTHHHSPWKTESSPAPPTVRHSEWACHRETPHACGPAPRLLSCTRA